MVLSIDSVLNGGRLPSQRPGSDRWSLYVFPRSSCSYVPGHHCTDTEPTTKGWVGFSFRGTLPESNYFVFSDLCRGVLLTLAGIAKDFDGVLDVFDLRTPTEIAETVVNDVSVLMISLPSFLRRADECHQNKSRYGEFFSFFSLPPPQGDVKVAAFLRALAKHSSLAYVSSCDFDADSSAIRDRVNIFVARYLNPLFHNLNPSIDTGGRLWH